MKCWLGVISASHVRRALDKGIAQIGHGKRAPLARMSAGDWLVYYSPREEMDDKATLKSLTAIGKIADDEIWQADEGDFKPFRRRVEYEPEAKQTPIAPLVGKLEFTRGPNWGYQLRRGLIEISESDFEMIRAAMMPTDS